MSIKREAGVTLVELIVAIMIVGTALAGLVSVYNRASIASADPLIAQQMLAIAESMMEEVMQKPYGPDPTPASGRQFYNDVADYDGYTSATITNVNGDVVAGLERYRVSVLVKPTALTNVPASDALRIQVTVSAPNTDNVVLTGWRTRP